MKKELLIHWTTDNFDTSLHMVLLYAHNTKKNKLWDEITVLVWGASQKLVKENEQIADEVKKLHSLNVKVIACEHCAAEMNTTDALASCDIDMFKTGKFLTDWIQSGKAYLSV